jgi:heme A synthase
MEVESRQQLVDPVVQASAVVLAITQTTMHMPGVVAVVLEVQVSPALIHQLQRLRAVAMVVLV